MSVIEVKNLVKKFDKKTVLKGVNFHVEEGEVFGFIGPNGAGKTTTIRILATLLDPDGGSARIAGECVYNAPEKVRHLIGYMPDYYGVYDGVLVWEFLDFFAATYKISYKKRKSIVDDVMELTDLSRLKDKQVETLSKGMKQRLCLAKILLHDPKVLLLDEPAAGLDPRARIEIRALLKELGRMGKTILISSHILTELSDLCSVVGFIEKGDIIAYGGVDSIKEQVLPLRKISIKLMSDPAQAAEALTGYDGITNISHDLKSVNIEFQGLDNDIKNLLKFLVERDIAVIGFEERKRDLEDLFMKITKGEVS